MEDLIRFAIFWVKQHPGVIVGALVAFLALHWLLNRKSARKREAERVIQSLVDRSREKYKDVRPLR
ncbi:MAG: hypothetical protein ACREQQ_06475 [Candidatus Binatia bacterium]